MATRIDVRDRARLEPGSEFELLHGLEMYHQVLSGGKARDVACLHDGRYRVETVDPMKGIGEILLTHLDAEDPHQHKIDGGMAITILEQVSSLKDGFYAWFAPPYEEGGDWIPFQVFEIRGQKLRDLSVEQAPSGWLLLRHATYAANATEGGNRFYRMAGEEEAAEVAAELRHDQTPGPGDYLFFYGQSPLPPSEVADMDLTAGPSVYLQLLDVVGPKGSPYAIARVMGKWPRHNAWSIFPQTDVHPYRDGAIDFAKQIDKIGELEVGQVYALPFDEPDYSRRESVLMVKVLRGEKGWEHAY